MVNLMKNLNVAVIGGGFMCKAHVNGYRTARYIFSDLGVRAELAAVCVRDEEKAQALMQKYEFSRGYTDLDALMQDGSIDIYDVCTPAQTHAQIVQKLLPTGKNILCEKPLPLHSNEAEAMLAGARRFGTTGYTCFNYRFFSCSATGTADAEGERAGHAPPYAGVLFSAKRRRRSAVL